MANVIADGTSKQHWIPGVQRNLHETLVAEGVATVYTGPDRIIHNPYQSTPAGSDGTAATAYTVTDFQLGDDMLTVNRRATVSEHVDSIEQLQTRFDLAMNRMQESAFVIADKIDQYVLNLPVSYSGVVDLDDSNLNATPGTAGTPYQITNTNANRVPNFITQYLTVANANVRKGVKWVVSPLIMAVITDYFQGKGYTVADAALRNGATGIKMAGGVEIVVSNNLTHTVSLTLATAPSDGETFTLNGQTFTFKTSLGSTAGNVLIGANAAATQANLAAAINGTSGAGSTYVDISADKRAEFSRQNITLGSWGSNAATLTSYATLIVSDTSTNLVLGNVGVHTIAMVDGAIFLALPSDGMTYEKKAVSGKHGRELLTAQVYNATIWSRMAPQILDVYVRV